MSMTCEVEFPIPGPHPGCSEFANDGWFACTGEAVAVGTAHSDWNPEPPHETPVVERMLLCADHAADWTEGPDDMYSYDRKVEALAEVSA